MSTATMFLEDAQTRREALAAYADRGCVIVDEVFSPAQLAAMKDTWTGISASRRQEGRRPFATLLMMHPSTPGVANIVRDRRLVACMEGLLGAKIELIQSQLMFGAPGVKGFSAHQDNYYNRANPSDGIIAAWIALEDVDVENGALAMYPGSHKAGLVEARRDWLYLVRRSPDVVKSLLRMVAPSLTGENDSGVIERFVHAKAGQAAAETLEMKAGSVAFMHGDLIHFSHPNRSKARFRRSLLANYVRVGTTFASGKLTGRVPFDVYADRLER
jgi:ectoine hydroxylase-related dioxygenase (phytanoyl-CoA dioxygenase family)